MPARMHEKVIDFLDRLCFQVFSDRGLPSVFMLLAIQSGTVTEQGLMFFWLSVTCGLLFNYWLLLLVCRIISLRGLLP